MYTPYYRYVLEYPDGYLIALNLNIWKESGYMLILRTDEFVPEEMERVVLVRGKPNRFAYRHGDT
jgi:hypothetical protein